MVKEEKEEMKDIEMPRRGMMLVAASFLLMLGMIGGGYLISQADFSNDVDLSGMQSQPNVYVSSLPPEHSISASGNAMEKVAPDLLLIQLRVETQETGAKESQQENALVMADLTAKLKGEGLSDEDIKTSGYYVQPVYESEYICPPDDPYNYDYKCRYESKLVGYKTVHSLTLNVEDLSKGGDLIDASADAGEDQVFVDYVSFTLKDETREAKQSELLEEAAMQAKEKAERMTKGLGVDVGRVLSVSESYYYTPYYDSYYPRAYGVESAMAAPTVLSAGEVEVSVSVSAMFEVA